MSSISPALSRSQIHTHIATQSFTYLNPLPPLWIVRPHRYSMMDSAGDRDRLGIRLLTGRISVTFSDFSDNGKKAGNQRLSRRYFGAFCQTSPAYKDLNLIHGSTLVYVDCFENQLPYLTRHGKVPGHLARYEEPRGDCRYTMPRLSTLTYYHPSTVHS